MQVQKRKQKKGQPIKLQWNLNQHSTSIQKSQDSQMMMEETENNTQTQRMLNQGDNFDNYGDYMKEMNQLNQNAGQRIRKRTSDNIQRKSRVKKANFVDASVTLCPDYYNRLAQKRYEIICKNQLRESAKPQQTNQNLESIQQKLQENDRYLLNFKKPEPIGKLIKQFRPSFSNTSVTLAPKQGKLNISHFVSPKNNSKQEHQKYEKEVSKVFFDTLAETQEQIKLIQTQKDSENEQDMEIEQEQEKVVDFLNRQYFPLWCDKLANKLIKLKERNQFPKEYNKIIKREEYYIALMNILFGQARFDFVKYFKRKYKGQGKLKELPDVIHFQQQKQFNQINFDSVAYQKLVKEKFFEWVKNYLNSFYSEIFKTKFQNVDQYIKNLSIHNISINEDVCKQIEQILIFKLSIGDLDFIQQQFDSIYEFKDVYAILGSKDIKQIPQMLEALYNYKRTFSNMAELFKADKDGKLNFSKIQKLLAPYKNYKSNTNSNPFWMMYLVWQDYTSDSELTLSQLFNEIEEKKLIQDGESSLEFHLLKTYATLQSQEVISKENFSEIYKKKSNIFINRLAWFTQLFLFQNLENQSFEDIDSAKNSLRFSVRHLHDHIKWQGLVEQQIQLYDISKGKGLYAQFQVDYMAEQIYMFNKENQNFKTVNEKKQKFLMQELEACVLRNYSQFNFSIDMCEKLRKLISNNIRDMNFCKLNQFCKIQYQLLVYYEGPKLILTCNNEKIQRSLLNAIKDLSENQYCMGLFSKEKQLLLLLFKWFLLMDLNEISAFSIEVSEYCKQAAGDPSLAIEQVLEKVLYLSSLAVENSYNSPIQNMDLCRDALKFATQQFSFKAEHYEKEQKLSIFCRKEEKAPEENIIIEEDEEKEQDHQ